MNRVRAFGLRCWNWVAAHYRHVGCVAWLGLVLPFFVWVSVVAALAPYIQQHTVPLVSTTAPSIYDAVYPDSLARMLVGFNWFSALWGWAPPFVAFLTTAATFTRRKAREQAIAAGVSFCLAFVLVDLVLLGTAPEMESGPGLLIGANLVGGVLFSVLTFLVFGILRLTLAVVQALGRWRPFVGAVVFTGVALIFVFVTDVGLRLFYRPLHVKVDILAGRAATGMYSQRYGW